MTVCVRQDSRESACERSVGHMFQCFTSAFVFRALVGSRPWVVLTRLLTADLVLKPQGELTITQAESAFSGLSVHATDS